MNCRKSQNIAKIISTSPRKCGRNCKQKSPKEENRKDKTVLPMVRKIQVRGTQTTLSTTMAWQGMWSDKLSSKQPDITSCLFSSKRTSSASRKIPSKISIYKNLMVRKAPYLRFKSSSPLKEKEKTTSDSPSSSTLSMTPCSEASSDLIEVGQIYETLPIDDCVVGHTGVQTDLFAAEHPQFGIKLEWRRNNNIVLRNSQKWESKKKPLRNSPVFSPHVSPQASNTKSCESLNTICTALAEEFKLPLEKYLQNNQIQMPTDFPRNYDEVTTFGAPEQNFYFSEDPPNQISSSSDLLRQPISPSQSVRSHNYDEATTFGAMEQNLHVLEGQSTKISNSSELLEQPVCPSKCVRSRNSDEATKFGAPEQYFYFPEGQLTQISSSSELLKQPVPTSKCARKEGGDFVIDTRATPFTPSLTSIPEERHETREASNVKERTLSDLSKRLEEYEVSKSMFSTPSNSLLTSILSSTLLKISQDDFSYVEQNSPQNEQKFQEKMDSPLHHYRTRRQSQSSETSSTVTSSKKYLSDRQEPVPDLRNGQVQLNSQENQEIAQYKETSSTGLLELPQTHLITTPNKMDLKTQPVMQTKNNSHDHDTKLLEKEKGGVPNEDEHTKSDLTLQSDKLEFESVDRFHEDIKVDINQNRTFKSYPESLSLRVARSITNSDKRQYPSLVQLSTKNENEESQNPTISGGDQKEPKKTEPFSEWQTMGTPTKGSRSKESGIYALNKSLRTCSREPNTPISKYSLPQRATTKPVHSENSKAPIPSDSLDQKENDVHRTNALITQKSNSTNNENRRQQFIFTQDRQISPFLRYKKPEYQKYMGSIGTSTTKVGISSLHKCRLPLRTRRIADNWRKNPLLTRHIPIGSATSDFLRNTENRSFAMRHLIPFKKLNSNDSCPTKCKMKEKRNVYFPAGKKVSTQGPSSKKKRIYIPVDCEKELHPPATSDVTKKPQDSLNQDELIVDTMSHDDEVGSNVTGTSRSKVSQTRISVRDTKVVDGEHSSTTTSTVTYGIFPSNNSRKRSSSLPEFWKSLVLPRYAQKCLSLSQIDTDETIYPVTKHNIKAQSIYTVSPESRPFQTCHNYVENDLSQLSENTNGSRKSTLKTSHTIKLKNQNSVKSPDRAMHRVNKNAGILSPPEISSRGNKITMSNQERMVQRLKREEYIRQWVLKKQGKSSPKAKSNLCDTDSKKTKRSSSMNSQSSQMIPTIQEMKMNSAIDLKYSQTGVVMDNKSRHSEDSCSSKIKKRNNISEKNMKYLPKDLETKKTLLNTQKRGQKLELKVIHTSPEPVLNSHQSKGKNDSISEKSHIIQKQMKDKGLHCDLHITPQNTSQVTEYTQAFDDHTQSEKAHYRIEKRQIEATKSFKQRDQSHLKTPVPVTVLTLDPLPLYSMMGYTSEGNVIFQRVNKTIPQESQTEDSRGSVQITSSNSQQKRVDDLQRSQGSLGQFVPRPLPPPSHMRGLKRPVTRSRNDFENLKHAVKDTKKCAYGVVKDTKQPIRTVPPKRNSKLEQSRRTTSSTSQIEDPFINAASENHSTENKKYPNLNTRDNVDKPGHGGETEDNILPKRDTDKSRNEVAFKACQTDKKITYPLLNTPESEGGGSKNREMSCERIFQDNKNFSQDRYSKILKTNSLRYVNQTQKPRFPKVQHFRHIKSTENKFRDSEKIDEVTSEQEKDFFSEKNSSLDHSDKNVSKFHRNVNENRVPSSSRKIYFQQTTRNLQQRYPQVYQQNRRGQLSIRTRGKGIGTKKEERSDVRSNVNYLKKEKCLPTKEFLLSKRAKSILISSFSDKVRKLGQRILRKNRSYHSTNSSQSGSKSRGSFEISSHSSKPQNGGRLRKMRYITSPKSTVTYMNRNRVSNFDSPSYNEDENGCRGNYRSVLERNSSTSVDSHHFQSSYTKSSSNFQEDFSRSSKGIQCINAEPSGFVNNRVSKVSYTILKVKPKQNENIYWDDAVTPQKHSEHSYQKIYSRNGTALFQKNDTNSQSEKFIKDITTKSDKNRRLRDRTPSY